MFFHPYYTLSSESGFGPFMRCTRGSRYLLVLNTISLTSYVMFTFLCSFHLSFRMHSISGLASLRLRKPAAGVRVCLRLYTSANIMYLNLTRAEK